MSRAKNTMQGKALLLLEQVRNNNYVASDNVKKEIDKILDSTQIAVGDTVTHPKFAKGLVCHLSKRGNHAYVEYNDGYYAFKLHGYFPIHMLMKV